MVRSSGIADMSGAEREVGRRFGVSVSKNCPLGCVPFVVSFGALSIVIKGIAVALACC